MASIDLVLSRQYAPGQPTHLVLGDDGNTLPPGTFALHAEGKITGMRGSFVLRTATTARAAGHVTGMRGAFKLRWDANVSRGGLRQELQACWQDGQSIAAAASSNWHEAEKVSAMAGVNWQDAERVAAGNQQHWQTADRLHAGMRGHWQDGQGVRSAAAQHWQEAEKRRAGVDSYWQQQGVPIRAAHASSFGVAVAVALAQRHHWQEAMRPLPGVSSITPPVKHVCWSPSLPANLLFDEAWTTALPAHLVFACRGSSPPKPDASIVVPSLRSYIMINSIEIRRADSLAGDPLPSEAFAMSLDHQSWTWTFSATFHHSVADAVSPGPDGEPVELDVRINGQPFRLLSERSGKSARFPERLVKVSGRGKACLLADPHAPEQTFGNIAPRSAHQLMLDVLTINGAGMGWSVDWQLEDWVVPGNEWTHKGTYISALADIAGAAGGYLQPHDTLQTIRVLPRWVKPWWEWDGLVADISLPAGMGEVEESDWVTEPLYNRIFLEGGAGGITADFSRSGSDGLILKPMVVHPLITSVDVARQRAIAELSESGRKVDKTLTMAILPETGVIRPGTVLDFRDETEMHRIGIVRSTSINWTFPTLTQTLKVQCHA